MFEPNTEEFRRLAQRGATFLGACFVAWIIYVAFVFAEGRARAVRCENYAESIRVRPDEVIQDCPYG